MKNKMKRVLSMAMALMMVFSLIPVQAFATEGTTCTEHVWDYENGQLYAEATCVTAASYQYSCLNACGSYTIESVGEPTGVHNYVGGICTGCGEAEPAPASETTAGDGETTANDGSTTTGDGSTTANDGEVGETPTGSDDTTGTGEGSTGSGDVCEHTDTSTTTVEATCGAAGSVTVTCNACHETVSTEETAATGKHSYVDGVCATCGAEEAVCEHNWSGGECINDGCDAVCSHESYGEDNKCTVCDVEKTVCEHESYVKDEETGEYKCTACGEVCVHEKYTLGVCDECGAVSDVVEINTAEELWAFAAAANAGNNFSGKTVTLMSDIDLDGKTWTPIASFAGNFVGNGKTISNYHVDATSARGGFFNVIEGSNGLEDVKVRDLILSDVTATVGNSRFGTLANSIAGVVHNVTVKNVTVTTTHSNAWVGGMAAFMSWPWMTNCTVENLVVDANAGADLISGFACILQKNSNHVFDNLDVKGFKVTVNDTDSAGCGVGGFVGQTQRGWEYPKVINCDVSGIDVTASGLVDVGGFIAWPGAHTIAENCSTEGKIDVTGVTSKDCFAGGFFGNLGWNCDLGQMGHVLNNCSADVDITTKIAPAGGFVGSATNSNNNSMYATFNNCSASGDITSVAEGTADIGGFAGDADRGVYNNCSASGTVTNNGTGKAGQFIGAAYDVTPKYDGRYPAGTRAYLVDKITVEDCSYAGASTGLDFIGLIAEGADVTVINYVAQVGTNKYESFTAAVAAANAIEGGATVTLLKDVTLSEALTVAENVSISGYSINLAAGASVEVKGTVASNVTVSGTNAVIDGGIWNGSFTAAEGASLSIVSGFFKYDPSAYVAKGSIVKTLEDGTFEVYATKVYEVSTKAELDAAITAAVDGDVIRFTADIDYTGTATPEINKAVIIDLGGKTLTTHGTYGGLRLKGGCSLINGTLAHKGTVTAIKAWDMATIENLVIDVAFKEGKVIGGIVIQENSAGIDSINNVTIKGEGLTNGIETYNCGNAAEPVIGSMTNVTIDAVGTGMLISAPLGTATNCTIKGGVSGIEIWIKGTYSASLDLVDSTVTGGAQAVYAHDEFSSNPSIVNAGTIKLTADEKTTFASTSGALLTKSIARINEGTQLVLPTALTSGEAMVNGQYFATLKDAVAAANAIEGGATVYMLTDATLGEKLTITGNVTISGAYTITRADSYTGTLFAVSAGAALTLDGGLTIDGANEYVFDSELYAADLANWEASVPTADSTKWFTPEEGAPVATGYMITTSGTVNLNDVSIKNHYSTNGSGIVSASKGAVVTLTGAQITHNASTNGSGLVVNASAGVWSREEELITVTMNEGTVIDGNHVGGNHGIFKIYMGTYFTMNGGEIKNTTGWNSNGTAIGIYNAVFTMNGGTICSNSSVYGPNNGRNAAIYGHSNHLFTMNGGTICHNTGRSKAGIDSPYSETGYTGQTFINGGSVIGNSVLGNWTEPDVSGGATLTITGGTFTQDVSKYLAPNIGLAYDENLGTYSLTDDLYEYNGTAYQTLAELIAAVKTAPATFSAEAPLVTVLASHKVDETAIADIDLVIDLNGKTITGAKNEAGVQVYPVIRVQDGANVTVKNGEIVNDDYVFVLGASDGSSAGKLTIESGKYHGDTTVASVTKGELTVLGGEFSVDPYVASESAEENYNYLLNCIDANYADGSAKIVVKGGSYYNFNPAANAAEGANTNFVADGYVSEEKTEGVWTVRVSKDTLAPVVTISFTDSNTNKDVTLKYPSERFDTIQKLIGTNDYADFVLGASQSELLAYIADGRASNIVITLHDDVELDAPIYFYDTYYQQAAEYAVTLNLNGHSITNAIPETASTFHTIVNNADLTVTDSVGDGKIESNSAKGYAIYTEGGKLTVDGAKIVGTNWGYAIVTWTNGDTVTIKDGTVVEGRGALYLDGGATGVVNGGSFTMTVSTTNSQDNVVYVGGTSELTINGGTFTTGDITGAQRIAVAALGTSKVTINGGTFYGLTGDIQSRTSAGNVVVTGGTFTGTKMDERTADSIAIQGGTYSYDPTEWCAKGYVATKGDNETWTVDKELVVEMDGVKYPSIKDALWTLKSSDTTVHKLTVIKDHEIDVNYSTYNYPILVNGFAVEIDLNGKTITADWGEYTGSRADNAIIGVANGGKLTITDSVGGGKIVNNDDREDVENRIFWIMTSTADKSIEVTIKGGTFVQNDVNTALLYVQGNKPSDNLATTYVNIEGGHFETVNDDFFNAYDGYEHESYITGGTFNKNPEDWEIKLHPDFKAVENEDGIYTVVKKDYVAQVTDAEGKVTKHESVQDAVNAAASGATVALLADVTVTESIAVAADDEITLDLNGCTLQTDANVNDTTSVHLISNLGKLTIKDSLGTGALIANDCATAENGAKTKNGFAVSSTAGSTLTIDGAKIVGTNWGYALYVVDAATTVTIEDDTVVEGRGALYLDGGATGVVNGGSFTMTVSTTNSQDNVVYVGGTSELTINGGTFTTGDITGDQRIAVAALGTSKVTINGGEFYGLTGDIQSRTSAGNVVVTGGTFTGTKMDERTADSIAIQGGTYSYDPTEWCAKGHIARETETAGVYTVAEWDYKIYNKAELQMFRDRVNAGETFDGKTIELMADIDLAGENWTPIGNTTNYFCGNFDGGNHTISNMTINVNTPDTDQFLGLFGGVKNAVIKNLTMKDSSITAVGKKVRAAALVGIADSDKTTPSVVELSFENITVDGCTIKAEAKASSALVGGVVGYSYPANMTGIKVNGLTIDAKADGNAVNAAAIAAYVCGQNISNNGNTRMAFSATDFDVDNVSITANAYTVLAGAYTGETYYGYITLKNGTIDDLKIEVDANEAFVGGLVGYFHRSDNGHTVENVNITGVDFDVTTAYLGETRVGGMVGTSQSVVSYKDCSVSGEITERCSDSENPVNYHAKVGGFVGRAYTWAHSFENCVADVDINASHVAGGFIGNHITNASYTNCEAKGDVTANIAGGFAGRLTENGFSTAVTFDGCESSGNVTGTNVAGGFIGSTVDHGWAAWEADKGTPYAKTVTIKDCTITGNVQRSNGETAYVAGVVGEAIMKNSNDLILDNVSYQVEPPCYPVMVAQVGETKYVSLAEAVAAADAIEGGATVVMLANTTLDEKLTITGNVTISGAYTITRADSYTGTLFAVSAGATLTLDDGLTIDGANEYAFNSELYAADLAKWEASVPTADSTKWFTPEEGAPVATGYMITTSGTVNLNDVSIKNHYSTNGSGIVSASKGANVTLDGAQITHNASTNGSGLVVNASAGVWSREEELITVTMNEGTVIDGNHVGGNHGIFKIYMGTYFTMNGGEIKNTTGWNSNGTAIGIYHAVFTMNGGTICSNSSVVGPNNGRNAAIYGHSNHLFTMNGGTICHNTGRSKAGIDSPYSETGYTGQTFINGGSVIDNTVLGNWTEPDVSGGATLTITGGTFTQDAGKYLAPNCTLIYDEESGTYSASKEVYEYGGNNYHTMTEVVAAIKAAYDTKPVVTVIGSHKVDEPIVLDISMTIDLGGNTITGVKDADGVQVYPVIRVQGDANVTVKNGEIVNDDYVFVLGASDGSSAGYLTIESGKYHGDTTVASVTKGELTVEGGEFSVDPYVASEGAEENYNYLLNCIDANYADGSAKIVVKGGSFYNFNPAANAAEGTDTNFVPAGHASKELTEGVWTVHKHTEVIYESKAPTCTEPGLTEGKYCDVCEETLVEQTVVPATGHAWAETTYEWAADGKLCTAKRVCGSDASHVETANATITSTVSVPASCEAMGTTTYTANFTETWAETQNKEVEDVPATGHAWAETTYEWAADGKLCTAKRVCGNDASHVETANATITSTVSVPASCEAMGTTTYTASFTETWAETQNKEVEDVPATGHKWSEEPSDYEDNGDGTHNSIYVCANDETHKNKKAEDHKYIDHKCICDAEELVYVEGYTLSLKGDIAVNFFMHIDSSIAADKTGYMQFTTPRGGTFTISIDDARVSNGYYIFSAPVAAKEMTDTIVGQYFYNNGQSEEHRITIKQYADYIIDNADTVAAYGKAAPMIKAMLNYGAYSQVEFGYNTDNLASELVDLSAVTADTLAGFAVGKQGTEKVPFLGSTLLLKTETSLRLFFGPAGSVITYNGTELEQTKASSYVSVKIDNISAKDLDNMFTVLVNDGTETAEVKYSPMTHCYNTLKSADISDASKNTVKALYLYNQAADDYFE